MQAAALVLAAVAIHIAVLLPLAGSNSYILDHVFQPDAADILDGHAPYSEVDFEYPPGALPIVALPGLLADAGSAFRKAFGGWMLIWDVTAIVVLGFALRDRPSRLAGALAIYTIGLLALGRLSLARFDLVPATLALAAIVLRQGGRSAGWSLALGAGTAIKAWPIALLPPLLARERLKGLAVFLVILIPVVAGIAVWIATSDGPASAFSYHSSRDLQVESVAATPLLVADQLGYGATVVFGSGSFNLDGPTADALGTVAKLLLVIGYLLLAYILLARRVDPPLTATVLVGWLLAASPILSPQFLIWLLPLAALSLAARWEALPLLAAFGLTRLAMEHADEMESLGPWFTWSTVARNFLLLAWLVLVLNLALRARAKTSTPSSENTNLYSGS